MFPALAYDVSVELEECFAVAKCGLHSGSQYGDGIPILHLEWPPHTAPPPLLPPAMTRSCQSLRRVVEVVKTIKPPCDASIALCRFHVMKVGRHVSFPLDPTSHRHASRSWRPMPLLRSRGRRHDSLCKSRYYNTMFRRGGGRGKQFDTEMKIHVHARQVHVLVVSCGIVFPASRLPESPVSGTPPNPLRYSVCSSPPTSPHLIAAKPSHTTLAPRYRITRQDSQ